jgi:hypothetical protein
MRFQQTAHAMACAATLLAAAIMPGCSSADPAARAADAASASVTERAGMLSVTAFDFTGWHDDSFHYLPALSVTAPSIGRPVFVQRVDFTADEAGSQRLLKGVRYTAAKRVRPGDTVELVSDVGAADPSEIASPLALASVSAIVFFTDDEGQPGIVSAVGTVPHVPDRASLASLVIRQFTVDRRQHQGRFLYWPKVTLAETSGRSRASIRKIVFELLDVGAAGQAQPVWSAPVVPAGDTVSLDTGKDGRAPWFEIKSSADASRVLVAISFVDDAGRGGLVSAIAPVSR